MAQSIGVKINQNRLTFVVAGTQKDEDFMLHTVLHFASEEHLKILGADRELARLRAEAIAIVETGAFTTNRETAFII